MLELNGQTEEVREVEGVDETREPVQFHGLNWDLDCF